MVKNCEYLTDPDKLKSLINECETFIFDCDGVLWNINEIYPGVNEFINKLRKMNKKILVATNNSSYARSEYLEKINKMNLNFQLNDIYCTVHVICHYLINHFNFKGKKLYLIGSPNFKKALEDVGIKPEQLQGDIPDWAKTPIDPEVECVIVGFDKTFNFWKCLRAVSYLKNSNHLFIATNTDEIFPYPCKNVTVPGTGCIVACVTKSALREPWIAGKPCTPIFQTMIEEHNLNISKTIFFGDRLNTDILGANRNGMKSLLVLTGVTSREDLENVKKGHEGKNKCIQEARLENTGELLPDFFAESIDALNKLL